MFIIAELLKSIASLLSMLFFIVYCLLVIRIVLSWVAVDSYNEIVRIIYSVTDPVLAPFRRLPLQLGAIDFSPIVAFIALKVVGNFVVNVLYGMAMRLGG
jgi:YggT family protein